jgi:hypothetical protein
VLTLRVGAATAVASTADADTLRRCFGALGGVWLIVASFKPSPILTSTHGEGLWPRLALSVKPGKG